MQGGCPRGRDDRLDLDGQQLDQRVYSGAVSGHLLAPSPPSVMDPKQGLVVAYGHGPKGFTMRYKANVPHANPLGTNPWIDFKADMPVVLDKVK